MCARPYYYGFPIIDGKAPNGDVSSLIEIMDFDTRSEFLKMDLNVEIQVS